MMKGGKEIDALEVGGHPYIVWQTGHLRDDLRDESETPNLGEKPHR
jgi:hypothetical protein